MYKRKFSNRTVILPAIVGISAILSCAYLLLAALPALTGAEKAVGSAALEIEAGKGEGGTIESHFSEIALTEERHGEKYLDFNRNDRFSLFDRYRLPALSRMAEEDEKELVQTRQSIQRMAALKLNPEDLEFPDAKYKLLYNSVLLGLENVRSGSVDHLTFSESQDTEAVFEGSLASELNAFLRDNNSSRIVVGSRTIKMDETICVPSNTLLDGRGVILVPFQGEGTAEIGNVALLDRAILLDRVENSGVVDFIIRGGFKYGIYVKNSKNYLLKENDISGVEIKGLVIMGNNHDFYLGGNRIHENMDGGLYLDGDIYRGVIEDNQIVNNLGAANLSAGMVLCSIDIKDEDTAWNPWEDVYIYDITESPHELVVINNTIQGNRSSGCYSHAGYTNYFVQNRIIKNEKEGMCLDYGSVGNYVAFNIIRANGGRFRMSADDLKRDFIEEFGHLPDGSSPAKLPGLSLDNSSYNTIYQNIVADNYGSGVKAVRSSYRNTILCNEITDNNQGVSDQFHFFGVELATDMNADEEVKGLDFTPCYENIVARNTISGPHFAGIFYGTDTYVNDSFDNVIMGATNWSIESLSGRFNSVINNPSDCEMKIPAVLEGEKHE